MTNFLEDNFLVSLDHQKIYILNNHTPSLWGSLQAEFTGDNKENNKAMAKITFLILKANIKLI